MVDMLRRSLAPVGDAAWEQIDSLAACILRGNLSGRRISDFTGPHGWELAAVNAGRLCFPGGKRRGDVEWGIRAVQPLVETRVPFALSLSELDGALRGSKDPDLHAVEEAAAKAAVFEEKAVYAGFKEGGIEGIVPSSPHRPITITRKAGDYQGALERAVVAVEKQGIGGPFDLVLGTVPFETLMAGDDRGYPLRKRVEDIIRGEIRWSPALKGGVVLSRRGGDFEFTLGQDFSIGYYGHDGDRVDLYITESFTFRVLEPRAAVALTMKAG
jgi:uncharacterized linocin/CFP29 family protein